MGKRKKLSIFTNPFSAENSLVKFTEWAMLRTEHLSEEEKNRVMHIALPVGGDDGSDIVPSWTTTECGK
jgi:hypothetical protein